MRSKRRLGNLALPGLSLVLVTLLAIGCGEDSPTAPEGGGGTPGTGSNLSFDIFGASVVPGGTALITVTPLAGELGQISASSSNDAVATVSTTINPAANGASAAIGTILVSGVGFGSATITVSGPGGDKRDFPVTVYDHMRLDTGEMFLKFTNNFPERWHDSGSDADNDGDFYNAAPPADYHTLGWIGFAGYQNPNNVPAATMVVMDKGTNTANPPLAHPVDYEHVWNNGVWVDIFGNVLGWLPDGNLPGAFWRPVPPDGYVALGLVVHAWTPGLDLAANDPINQKPPLDAVMCVRADLTTTAKVDGFVWHDGGNGLSDRAFRADQLLIPDEYNDYESMHLAPGTFTGHPTHAVNTVANLDANILSVKPQIIMDADYKSNLWRPTLTSLEDPGDATQPLRTRSILLPFTHFADAGRDINWKVENSPFYVLTRTYFWDEECFTSGLADCEVSYTSGSTQSAESVQWESESVEVSVEAGFAVKGFGAKAKSTVTKSMGFAQSTGESTFEEKTVTSSVPAPGEGAILATWKAANRFYLYRHNGMVKEQVVSPWTIYEDAFHGDKFP